MGRIRFTLGKAKDPFLRENLGRRVTAFWHHNGPLMKKRQIN